MKHESRKKRYKEGNFLFQVIHQQVWETLFQRNRHTYCTLCCCSVSQWEICSIILSTLQAPAPNIQPLLVTKPFNFNKNFTVYSVIRFEIPIIVGLCLSRACTSYEQHADRRWHIEAQQAYERHEAPTFLSSLFTQPGSASSFLWSRHEAWDEQILFSQASG